MFEYDTVNRLCLQTPAKDVQWWRWRWCELRWQTVPDLGTSNRKGSVANGGPGWARMTCNMSYLKFVLTNF